jgi:hypothetical protein
MLKALITASLIAGATPALSTPLSHDTPQAEALGAACEAGDRAACHQLVTLTNGHCAAPAGSGCRYGLDLAPVRLAVDNGLMVEVPNVGLSRIETVSFCLEQVNVDRYQDLITDSDFAGFEGCLADMT